jgi:GNAT superfamily N-acetyltransferase
MDEQIRSGKESDAAAIVAVIRQWKLEERKTPIDDGAVERVVRLCTQSPECDVLVAEAHGRILGYVIVHWIPFPMLGGVEGYISDLLVGSAGRGAGVGSRLIAKVEATARDKGCVRLMLNNRIAAESFKREFYPKHGFQRRDEFANMIKMLR